jgi:hypothetical protein
MNRRSFFAALAALPFVPDALKRLGETSPPEILGYWVEETPGLNTEIIHGDFGDFEIIKPSLKEAQEYSRQHIAPMLLRQEPEVAVIANGLGKRPEEVQKEIDAITYSGTP